MNLTEHYRLLGTSRTSSPGVWQNFVPGLPPSATEDVRGERVAAEGVRCVRPRVSKPSRVNPRVGFFDVAASPPRGRIATSIPPALFPAPRAPLARCRPDGGRCLSPTSGLPAAGPTRSTRTATGGADAAHPGGARFAPPAPACVRAWRHPRRPPHSRPSARCAPGRRPLRRRQPPSRRPTGA